MRKFLLLLVVITGLAGLRASNIEWGFFSEEVQCWNPHGVGVMATSTLPYDPDENWAIFANGVYVGGGVGWFANEVIWPGEAGEQIRVTVQFWRPDPYVAWYAYSDERTMNVVAGTFTIVGGNYQTATPGAMNAEPFSVLVWGISGPLVETPFRVSFLQGGGTISSLWDGPADAPLASTFYGITGGDGIGPVYFQQPSAPGTLTKLHLDLGTDSVVFTTANYAHQDIDEDGLADSWELLNFGSLQQGPNDNPDGDAWSNAEEYRFGTNPNVAADVAGSASLRLKVLTPLQ